MKSVFKQYYDKLVKIGILKSVVFSLIVGFGVNFIVAFITCFIDMSVSAVLAASLGSGALAAVISAPLFYFFMFKPTTKKMAALLDKQGLEERIITMLELEDDESYIAMVQRENALQSLAKVSPKSLKVALSTLIVVILVASITLGIAMTTVTSLAAADIITIGNKSEEGKGPGQGDEGNPEDETVNVLYEAGEHGSVEGQLFQQLSKGGDASAVVAVPDEGYEFLYWTDGTFTAERRDTNVNVSFSVKAVFKEKAVVGDGPGEGEGNGGGGEGNGQGGQGGQGGQNGDGGGGGDGQGEGDGEEGNGQGGGGAGASGKQDNNTVIDGNQNYRDAVDYEAMREQIESDDSLTQEEKDMLLAYLKMLYGEGKGE
ncbi:MAG: hypothetical protein J1G05_06400 [Clostridiales bacterium]|nr:hypothetical protein [Clostridiales bacterium]